MLWLAFDTATERCVVAIGDGQRLLAEIDVAAPRDHMARLVPLIQVVLAEAGRLAIGDMDAIAVGLGPGSFTGVRIGVATAKGLARAAKLPLFGVPTLDVVAQAFWAVDRPIVVLADAARGEVYPMTYAWRGGVLTRADRFEVLDAATAAARLASDMTQTPPVLAGDGLLRHEALFAAALPATTTVAPAASWYPGARCLIERAEVAIATQSGDPDSVLPIYTRASDAERTAAERAARGAAG